MTIFDRTLGLTVRPCQRADRADMPGTAGKNQCQEWGGLLACSVRLRCRGRQVPSDAPDLSSSALTGTPVDLNELDRLGRQDIDAGNNGLAEEHFRVATEQNRDHLFAWIGLAAAYEISSGSTWPIRPTNRRGGSKGETLPILNNIGYSYYLRGDRRRALVQLEHALALDPSNPVILNNIRLVRSGERTVARRPQPSRAVLQPGRAKPRPVFALVGRMSETGAGAPTNQARSGGASAAGWPGQTTSD